MKNFLLFFCICFLEAASGQAQCTITVNFSGSPSSCDDNGTPNDPSDDFFTHNVQAIFFNRPLTGNLQIVPGGDQIGVYSIPVVQIVGNQHIFNNVMFKADGTPTNIQMNFTDDPGCIDDATGPTVQPCSAPPPPCTITVTFFGSPSTCNDNGTPNDPSDDFFTHNVGASFFNRPLTGELQIVPGGDQIGTYLIPVNQIVGNQHIFTNVAFKADGTPTNIQMNFTDEPTCIDEATGPAVQPCSVGGDCEIIGYGFDNIDPCDDNGTPDDASDDFFTVDVDVIYSNSSSGATIILFGIDLVQSPSAAAAIGTNLTTTLPNVRLRADGQITDFEGGIENSGGVLICTLPGTGPAVNSCSNGGPAPCAMTDIDGSNQGPCNNNGTNNNPNDDFFTLDVTVEFENPPATGTLDLIGNDVLPGGGDLSVAVSDLNGNSHTFEGIRYRADGQGTSLVARFSADHGCTIGFGSTFSSESCSFPPPALICPPHTTVTCANNVPAPDPTDVQETHSCPGDVDIVLSVNVNSGVVCPNNLTVNRIYQATDACGQTASCSQLITVKDEIDPTLTCPPNITVSCAGNVPPIDVNAVTNENDNCGGNVLITSQGDAITNQTCPNRFTILRTYFAVDDCGNSNNCIQTITVNDQTAPSLSCPASQTVSCAEQVPAPNLALVTGLSDNCGGAVTPGFVSDVIGNQSCINRFTLTRTYRAIDVCGNSRTCTQIITVRDQTPPTFSFVPANITVDCYEIPTVGIATASDNCTSGATVAFLGETIVPGICPVYKILTRTWRATDACGNSATAIQVINVTDTNAPQFLVLPQNEILECGPENLSDYQIFLDTHGGAVVQDCAEITYSHEEIASTEGCGHTFFKRVRFFATDECGNVSFRDAFFTVVDQTPPAFTIPPQSLDIECDDADDDGESAFYDWLQSNAGLSVADNCGAIEIEKVAIGEAKGCGKTWSKTYEFRAKDECGNLAKTTATFALVDRTSPLVECPSNDNVFLSCVEEVPLPSPAFLAVWDCNPVTVSHQDTWTNGTGCPNWTMTVAHRYVAKDACGNEAVCEQAFYVRETETPTLVCPDTIKLTCVDDIPGPSQVFASIQNQLAGNCVGGVSSIFVIADSGQPQGGVNWRSYSFTAKTHCGIATNACTVTFLANGNCNQLCTATQNSWGDPAGSIGNMSTADALEQLLQAYGPVKVGGGNHLVVASDAACVQELLFGSGTVGFLPTGVFSCPLPVSLSNGDGSMNNQLASNALALQLNIWYNLEFNERDLSIQNLHDLPPCLVEFSLLKDLGQNSSVQDLLNLTNQYLQGYIGNWPEDLPMLLNAALANLNHFRMDCGLNAPCERPSKVRSEGVRSNEFWNTQLSPNPASDFVTLTFESANEGAMSVQISDGKTVIGTQKIQARKGSNKVSMSMRNLPAGVYTLHLHGMGMPLSMRVVKISE